MSTLDALRWDAGHPEITEIDWNRLLRLLERGGIIKSPSYIIWIDGATIRAVNGTTGDVDYAGADASTVIQAAIDALELGGVGGLVLLRCGTYDLNTTLTIQGDGIILAGETRARTTDGVLLRYLGAAQGVVMGQTTALVWNSGVKSLRIYNAGTGTDGIQCYGQQCLFDDIQVSYFDSGLVLEGQQVGVNFSGDNRVFGCNFDNNTNYGLENYAGDTFCRDINCGQNGVGLLIKSPAYHSGGFYGVNINSWGGNTPVVLDSVLNVTITNIDISTAGTTGMEIMSSTHETMRITIMNGRIWNNVGANEHVLFTQTNNMVLNRVLFRGINFDVTTQVLNYTEANAGFLHSIMLDACIFDDNIDIGNYDPLDIRIRNALGAGFATESWGTGMIGSGLTTDVITHRLGDTVGNGYTPQAAEIDIIPITIPTSGFHVGLFWTSNYASGTFQVNSTVVAPFNYTYAWVAKMRTP